MKLLQVASAAALIAASATLVMAQTTQTPSNPSQAQTQTPSGVPSNPSQAATTPGTGSGSKALSPGENAKPLPKAERENTAPGANPDTKQIPKSPN
jgi:hypothetical protein